MIKTFEQWLNEDFATVASTPGMGDVVPATATTVGSGDQWPSLGAPYTLLSNAKKKKRKKKKKKLEESFSDQAEDGDIGIFNDALIAGFAKNENITDKIWLGFVDQKYGTHITNWSGINFGSAQLKLFRKMYASGNYEFHYDVEYDMSEEVKNTNFYDRNFDNEKEWTHIFYKEMHNNKVIAMLSIKLSEKEKQDNMNYLLSYLKDNRYKINNNEFLAAVSMLSDKQQYEFRGAINGKQFGL